MVKRGDKRDTPKENVWHTQNAKYISEDAGTLQFITILTYLAIA